MEKQIEPILVLFGNNFDDELETYKVFNQIDDPKIKNERAYFSVVARDVPVRRPQGLTFMNWMLGRPTIIGKLELDKKRSFTIKQDLVFPIKMGTPSVTMVFPDNFDNLPESFKNHKFFGSGIKVAYLEMESVIAQAELMKEAGYQETEILDKLSQSQTQAHEYMLKQFQQFSQQQTEDLKSELNNKPKEPKDGGFY